FGMLPAGTIDTLLRPEKKGTLTKLLTYHVVSGRISIKEIKKRIRSGGGIATLRAVSGGTLAVAERNGRLWIQDEKGGVAAITIPDSLPVERRHPRDRHRPDAQVSVRDPSVGSRTYPRPPAVAIPSPRRGSYLVDGGALQLGLTGTMSAFLMRMR